jgi:anti-anti-sigma regulatory factor
MVKHFHHMVLDATKVDHVNSSNFMLVFIVMKSQP